MAFLASLGTEDSQKTMFWNFRAPRLSPKALGVALELGFPWVPLGRQLRCRALLGRSWDALGILGERSSGPLGRLLGHSWLVLGFSMDRFWPSEESQGYFKMILKKPSKRTRTFQKSNSVRELSNNQIQLPCTASSLQDLNGLRAAFFCSSEGCQVLNKDCLIPLTERFTCPPLYTPNDAELPPSTIKYNHLQTHRDAQIALGTLSASSWRALGTLLACPCCALGTLLDALANLYSTKITPKQLPKAISGPWLDFELILVPPTNCLIVFRTLIPD